MSPNVIFILTISTTFVGIATQSTSQNVIHFKLKRDKLDKQLKNATVQTLWNVSLAVCARECYYLQTCKSMNFKSVDRFCELNSRNSSEASLVKDVGFVFSDKADWPKGMSGTCSEYPCSTAQKCFALKPPKCIAWCGDPANVKNANYDTGDHVMSTEGAVRSYTCDERHVMTSSKNTVTCQPNSKWSAVQFQCIANCGPPPTVYRTVISSGPETENQTRTYTCQGRHYAPSAPHATIVCQMNTYWSPILFSCVLTCAGGWTQLHSSCYLFLSSSRTWVDTETECGRLQPGGHLANVLSQEINEMLSTLTSSDWIWIAANRRDTNDYVWSDNTPVKHGFESWEPGEPNYTGGEHCVYYIVGEPPQWDDDDCDWLLPGFCEYEMS